MTKTKKKETKDTIIPRYYEVETFRRSTNRKIWFGMIGLVVVAMTSIFLALVALARPIPVVVFDNEGQPTLFTDTRLPRQTLTDVRIEYFCRDFIKKWVGVDSAAINEYLEESLKMMTPRRREIIINDEAGLTKRNGYHEKNIKTFFPEWKVRIGRYDPQDLSGIIHVLVNGRVTFEPRFGEMESGDSPVYRWFQSQLVLQRVPVSLVAIHGLQVDFEQTKFFDSEDDLNAYIMSEATRKSDK